MENIIDVVNLVKRYPQTTAVDGVSFHVRQGEIFGILGPNGAGKTTTLEMIEGMRTITSGTAILGGFDVKVQSREVKSLIGVQLQSSSFFDGLNLRELLETFGALYHLKVDARKLLSFVQLEEKAKAQIKELSGGQKQRFSIACALVNDPKILFLDEPTNGLDPQSRRHLWRLIETINKKGKTIVLTTHYMDEAEILCDRIAIMDHAHIIALDTTENLLKFPGLDATVHFRTDKPCDLVTLKKLTGVTEAVLEDHTYRLGTNHPEKILSALFKLAKEEEFKLFDLQLNQPTLEDVFLKLTGHAPRD